MNPYLRKDVENTIEQYWRDIHKSKFNKVLGLLLNKTILLHVFCNRNKGDLNYSYLKRPRYHLRVGIYVYHFWSSSLVYIHDVLSSNCSGNKIKSKYIQEIQTRYTLQGK